MFQISQSRQSKAIEEAQDSPYTHMGVLVKLGSKWFVFEAIQPVTKTEVTHWIKRGLNSHVLVKRLKPSVFDMGSAHHCYASIHTGGSKV